MGVSPDEFPGILSGIYDSAVDEPAWRALPRVLGRLTEAQSGSVFVESTGAVSALSAWNLDAAAGEYLDYFHRLDPWTARARMAPRLRSMLGEEILEPERYAETEYYRDFARKYGMFHALGSHSPLAAGLDFQIALHRPREAGSFEPEDQRMLDMLLPHVQRALQLRRRLALEEARSTIGFATLDALSFAVLVCEAEGAVRFANAAAEALEQEGWLRMGAGRAVGAPAPGTARELRRLVHDAATGGAGGALRLPKPGGRVLLALVAPLPRRLRDPGSGDRLALVAIRPAGEAPAFGRAVLAALFGLTPAEADLALALLSPGSLEEIAAERGVSMATVRTQLRSLFAKTGTENQRDLVRLLGTIPQIR